MSVNNSNVLDGIGLDRETGCLRLLIKDPFVWEGPSAFLSEYKHLRMLQNKLNAYFDFLRSGQYERNYPNQNFSRCIIEMRFRGEIPDSCIRFLRAVQKKVGDYGIHLEAQVGG